MKPKHHKRIAQNLEIVKRLQRNHKVEIYTQEMEAARLEFIAYFEKCVFKK